MNKKCLKCEASLACLTGEALMRLRRSEDVMVVEVFMYGKIAGTVGGATANFREHICFAPQYCPRVRKDHLTIHITADARMDRGDMNWGYK